MATEQVNAVDVNTKQAQASVASLRKEIAGLRDEMLNLAQGSDEYNKKAEEVQTIQDKINSVMRIGKKDVVAVEGSYYALNAQLVELRKAYKMLSEEERKSDVGKAMIQNIESLDRQLKALDADMGQYQRNVGNYTNSILQAGTQMGGSFGGAVTGIKNANNALKIMSANPVIAVLGLIATLLSKVIGGLKSSEENTVKMTQAFSGFKVVGDAVTKILQKLGEWLGKIAEKFTEWVSGIESVKEAMQERQRIAETDIAIMKKERENIKDNADAQLEISKLRAQAAEKDKYTAQERIAMLERAKELEEGIAQRNYELLKMQYEQIRDKNALTQSSSEDLQKEAEAYSAMVNAETAYYNKTKELNAQMAEARKSIRSENAKTAKEVKDNWMTEVDVLKLNLSQRLQLAEKGSKEELNIRLLQLAQEYELEKERLATTIQNEDDRQTALLNAEQIFQQSVLTLETEFYDEQDRLREEELERERQARQAQDDAERERMEKEKADWILLQRSKVAIVQNSLSTITGLYEAFGGEQAKQSEGFKAVASAQAIIQALLSANEAYASMASIPYVGPALGAVASASALAAGMANVRQIWSTNMSKGTSTTASIGSSTPSVVSSPAVIQQVQTTRTLTGVEEERRAEQAQRVYLVYDDVQQAGRKVDVRQSETTF